MGRMDAVNADQYLQPVVLCIGDIGANQAFYICSNTWFGGEDAVLKMGHVPYMLKMQYKKIFFGRAGKVPDWSVDFAQIMTERSYG